MIEYTYRAEVHIYFKVDYKWPKEDNIMNKFVENETNNNVVTKKYTKRNVSIFVVVISLILCLVLIGHFVLFRGPHEETRLTRTVTSSIDYMAMLDDTFDWHNMTVEYDRVTLEAERVLTADFFSEIENLSLVDAQDEMRMLFDVDFDLLNNRAI